MLVLKLINLHLLIGLIALVRLYPLLEFVDVILLLVNHILEVEVLLDLLVSQIPLLLHLLNGVLLGQFVDDLILLVEILSQLIVLLSKLSNLFVFHVTEVFGFLQL